MDGDFLLELFSEFGVVALRRMFSGYGVSADGINFALALRGGIYLRADQETIPDFEVEGCQPFQCRTRLKLVTVASYWQLPERLYDDPAEVALWARKALAAAERAAFAKPRRPRHLPSSISTPEPRPKGLRDVSTSKRLKAAVTAKAKTRAVKVAGISARTSSESRLDEVKQPTRKR